MYFWFGIFDQSIFWIMPSSTMPGVYSAVGAPKSYWPTPPACSLASIVSLLSNVSYVNFSTPNTCWNRAMLPVST